MTAGPSRVPSDRAARFVRAGRAIVLIEPELRP